MTAPDNNNTFICKNLTEESVSCTITGDFDTLPINKNLTPDINSIMISGHNSFVDKSHKSKNLQSFNFRVVLSNKYL